MARLLIRLGAVLPCLIKGQDLIRESRAIEQRCWRELGLAKQPLYVGDIPDFLMTNGFGNRVALSRPMEPENLAARLASLESQCSPAESRIGTNLDTLARLLNLSPFEFQWLLWSYCVRRFGRSILPVVPLREDRHACAVLALLSDVPVSTVHEATASRRLHTWGFLDGVDADGEMPSLLSGWLSATDKFADWIEQSYASTTDLVIALCEAQVSLSASR
ncbi:hypothetical protein [Acidovorax temperans]|uniref:hypothetical protein n=1 Tax=Acidovorax temperans TaxID=80878 RepID=UPI0012EE374E|nr:hypothetical protein [Acidovorax temperans]